MQPETPKDKGRNREVQMGLFSPADMGEVRLLRPSEGLGYPRTGDQSQVRPARGIPSDQPLLPFGRPKSPPREPTADDGNRAEIPASHSSSALDTTEPHRPVADSPEPVASGEVLKARELLQAIRVLKRVEGEGRRPDAEERKALERYGGFGAVALRVFPDPVTGQYKTPSWQTRRRSRMRPGRRHGRRESFPNSSRPSRGRTPSKRSR